MTVKQRNKARSRWIPWSVISIADYDHATSPIYWRIAHDSLITTLFSRSSTSKSENYGAKFTREPFLNELKRRKIDTGILRPRYYPSYGMT